jgi:hypothetical protein
LLAKKWHHDTQHNDSVIMTLGMMKLVVPCIMRVNIITHGIATILLRLKTISIIPLSLIILNEVMTICII